MAERRHATCIETTNLRAGDQERTWLCGPDCPKPAGPDPERDKRVDAYRDRERRRAARALDRYLELLTGFEGPMPIAALVASERFVEQVGDYVLARLQPELCPCATDPTAARTPSPLLDEESRSHHKSHYGAPPTVIGETTASACRNTDHEHFPGDPILESCRAHNAADDACGASLSARCFNGELGCRVHRNHAG